jgi:hypothetical protein
VQAKALPGRHVHVVTGGVSGGTHTHIHGLLLLLLLLPLQLPLLALLLPGGAAQLELRLPPLSTQLLPALALLLWLCIVTRSLNSALLLLLLLLLCDVPTLSNTTPLLLLLLLLALERPVFGLQLLQPRLQHSNVAPVTSCCCLRALRARSWLPGCCCRMPCCCCSCCRRTGCRALLLAGLLAACPLPCALQLLLLLARGLVQALQQPCDRQRQSVAGA